MKSISWNMRNLMPSSAHRRRQKIRSQSCCSLWRRRRLSLSRTTSSWWAGISLRSSRTSSKKAPRSWSWWSFSGMRFLSRVSRPSFLRWTRASSSASVTAFIREYECWWVSRDTQASSTRKARMSSPSKKTKRAGKEKTQMSLCR